MTIEQSRQRVRRALGLEQYRALLGDSAGVVIDRPGYVRVRYASGDTTGLKNVVLVDDYTGPMKSGTPVKIKYNEDGELCLSKPWAKGQLATGADPVLNNPVAIVSRDDQNPFTFVPFMSTPTTPPSQRIVVLPWVYKRNGKVYHYPGEQVDLSATGLNLFPASGQWRIIQVLMKTDNTLEVLASSAQPATAPFDLTDLQEIADAATAEDTDGYAWIVRGDATTLVDADKIDLRDFINHGATNWEAYTPTGTADTHGKMGDRAYDDSYLYIKTSGGWKRAGLSSF